MNRRGRKSWAGPVATVLLLLGLTGRGMGAEVQRLSASEIVLLANSVQGDDEASTFARQELVAAVQAERLANSALARQFSLEDWHKVVWALRRGLSGSARAAWIVKLREAFVPAVGAPAHQTVIDYARLMYLLGAQDTTATVEGLFERIWSAGPVGWETCLDIATFWNSVGNNAAAKTWAGRTYEVLLKDPVRRRKVSLEELRAVAVLYDRVGLWKKGVGYTEFAEALVSLAERGWLRGVHYDHCLGAAVQACRMLSSDEALLIVRAGLLDANGYQYEGLSETLAWAYQFSGLMSEWKAFLEEKIGSDQVGPDEKAYWLLARAYAEVVAEGSSDPFIGKPWMTRALATAVSPDVRLYVVERIAMAHAFVARRERGLSFLESVAGQFPTRAEAFAEVRNRFLWMCTENEAYAAEKQPQRRKAENYRLALSARLSTAKQQGDRAVVERCEQLLKELAQRERLKAENERLALRARLSTAQQQGDGAWIERCERLLKELDRSSGESQ